MCLSTPKIPEPQQPQAAKEPDMGALAANARRNRTTGGMASGSLLTGPSGVANAAVSTSKTTLLGG